MNSKVKFIFLDIGGVIFEISWRPVLNSLGITDPTHQQNWVDRFQHFQAHHQYERGEINDQEFLLALKDFSQFSGSDQQLIEAWNQVILHPLPEIAAVFEKYKGKIPLCTLSNTNSIHMNFCFQKFDVLQRFDHYCMSYEMGARKPELEIYAKAMNQFNLKPEECLFIDDTLENVQAAKSLGIQAHLSVNSVEKTLSIIEAVLIT